ncbi:hypothetical protein Zmor_007441 [Zophobas morio]|uniref:Uncharacterized protein n=1 Tax=Zophobas morio TaxID=2755281 RepID=A0AA38IZQ9_9CUCU|nr:hypothetical protein Zmor_007441 [Zophobas morio]
MIRCLHRTVGSWFMAIFSIQSVLIWYSFMMCTNICITGTASPRSWYLHPQTHDRGRDRTERILQAEEQILERDEEEPDTSTRRLAAEVGVSQLVVHRTLKEHYGVNSKLVAQVSGAAQLYNANLGIKCWLLGVTE